MRIGKFCDSYRPYTSGVVRSVETFTTEMTQMGHEVFIFAPNYPNCKEEPRVYRFFSIPSPTNKDFTLALPFSLGLWAKVKELNLDVIHVHSPFILGRVGAKYARRLGIPLVFTYHTLYDQYVHYVPFGQNITKEITQKFTVDFCNQCDQVIVPTGVIANHLRAQGVRAPIQPIPTGIYTEEFKKAEKGWLRNKYGIPHNKKVLIFVGRLGQEKNIDFLFEAYKKIWRTHPDTRLLIVGGGPEEERLKAAVQQSDFGDNIIFTGNLSKEDVIKSYVDADIFVFASVTETQGLVIAEAKAAGLPVVAVDAFGVSEMVVNGEDGYLCPLDKDLFANSVNKLLENSQLRHIMGQKAMENAELLSSRNCALKLVSVYKSLIRRKRSRIDRLHG
ncbi:glycosyltransferase family 4 protein [Desulfofalx alkaliphila]|uniref:glycosyltransferase family 4 protein n=1 Tax=Desulfofalx alkaliphila TaxID=105483 RepID=UPI0004E1D05E|nr:glycosyltransferase family 4 protein [Desulfofalx alkaliphila]